MTSAAENESWSKAFERVGPKTLRLRIENERSGMQGEYLRAAEAWLVEQDALTERQEIGLL